MKILIKKTGGFTTHTSADGKEVKIYDRNGNEWNNPKDYEVTENENVDEVEYTLPTGIVFTHKWQKKS